MENHPLKTHEQFPLWISEATNFKNKPLGLRGAEKIVEDTMKKAGIKNKHARLYILRHSRATHLAKHPCGGRVMDFFRMGGQDQRW